MPPLNPQQEQIGCFLQEQVVGEFLSKAPADRRSLLNQILGVGHCPTCFQPMSEDQLQRLESRFQEQQQNLGDELHSVRKEEQEQRDTLRLLEQ